ncbi:hypothetical protein AAVH_22777 [Aphelenchoides avenae]|nr:hypothetical protein AAVH_22777 [Aphelenchus avenae]
MLFPITIEDPRKDVPRIRIDSHRGFNIAAFDTQEKSHAIDLEREPRRCTHLQFRPENPFEVVILPLELGWDNEQNFRMELQRGLGGFDACEGREHFERFGF